MKSIILIAVLLFVINFSVTAQYSQSAKDSAQIEIQQLNNEWNKAIINRDSLTLERILTPEYSLYSSMSGFTPRNIWINSTLHHFTTDTLETLGQLKITFYGQAVKSEQTLFWKAAYDGNPKINTEFLITDIWVKRNGKWQVLLRMSLFSRMR